LGNQSANDVSQSRFAASDHGVYAGGVEARGGRRTANFSPCSIGTDKEAVIGVAILDL